MDKKDQRDASPDDQPETKPERKLTFNGTEDQKITTEAEELTAEAIESTSSPKDTDATEFENDSRETGADLNVSVEAEPATGATSTVSENTSAAVARVDSIQPSTVSTETATASPAPKNKKRTIILAIIAVAVIISGAIVLWLALKPADTEDQQSSVSTSVEQPKLGVAISVADGTVEFSSSNNKWQPLTSESQLTEGATVRTGEGSRTVLTLDDGSAVRLDAQSSIKVTSLAADDIRIDHLAGSVYSRVVPSERTYTVNVDDVSYVALGTAFITIKTATENGVQVIHSSVKASGAEAAVGEGKQYYKTSSNSELKGKVTDINLGTLAGSEFITWNLSEDEKDDKFKDKLGVLSLVKERISEEQVKRNAIEAERLKAATEAARKTVESTPEKPLTDPTDKQAKPKVTRGDMKLWRDGDSLNWSYTGQALHGYKLVYADHDYPTFDSDKSIYVNDHRISLKSVTQDFKKHTSYRIRVCAYTAGTENDKCVDYSSQIEISRT